SLIARRSRAAGAMAVLAPGLLLGLATSVQAQSYPTKPVTLSSPYQYVAAGEVVFRSLLGLMEKQWGQRIIVEFRLGGNELPKMTAVMNGPSDGYLIGITSQNFSLNWAVQKMPFEQKEFVPITPFQSFTSPVVVSAKVPVKTMAEFIAYAKANPGKVNFATI